MLSYGAFTSLQYPADTSIPAPPSTADVFDFNANTYSGTGDWIDTTSNAYPATVIGSPTLSGATNSKYFDLNGSSDGFRIEAADLNSKFWSSQLVAGGAIGSLEMVYWVDSTTSHILFGQWSATEYDRVFLVGGDNTTSLYSNYQTTTTGRSYVTTTGPSLSTGTWLHYVLRWDQSSDLINWRISSTTYNSPSGWANTGNTWNAETTVCATIGYLVDGCTTNAREFLNGRIATMRGYNSYLSDAQVDALATYWSNYY